MIRPSAHASLKQPEECAAKQPFLDNAAVYYKSWNYPNVKRVSAMEQVLDDLGNAKGHVDKFRLVAHAASDALLVEVFEYRFQVAAGPRRADANNAYGHADPLFRSISNPGSRIADPGHRALSIPPRE